MSSFSNFDWVSCGDRTDSLIGMILVAGSKRTLIGLTGFLTLCRTVFVVTWTGGLKYFLAIYTYLVFARCTVVVLRRCNSDGVVAHPPKGWSADPKWTNRWENEVQKKREKKEIRSERQCSGALCRTKSQEREYKNGEKRQDVSLRLPLAVVGGWARLTER